MALTIDLYGHEIKTEGQSEFWLLVENGAWEKNTFEVMNSFIEPGKIFVDIGAWIGVFSIYASKLGAMVLAAEPDPIAFEEMAGNVKVNKLQTIWIMRAAISDKNGVAQLNTTGEFGNSESSLVEREGKGEVIMVETITLESFLDYFKVNPDDIWLIKIDIEGGEVALLKQAAPLLEEYKPVIHLSLHPNWIGEEGIDEIAKVIFPIYNVASDTGTACTPENFKEVIATHQHAFLLTPYGIT